MGRIATQLVLAKVVDHLTDGRERAIIRKAVGDLMGADDVLGRCQVFVSHPTVALVLVPRPLPAFIRSAHINPRPELLGSVALAASTFRERHRRHCTMGRSVLGCLHVNEG